MKHPYKKKFALGGPGQYNFTNAPGFGSTADYVNKNLTSSGNGLSAEESAQGIEAVSTVSNLAGTTLGATGDANPDKANVGMDILSGGLKGMGKGAAIGASLGTVVPVIGNVVGGVVGGAIGLVGGEVAGLFKGLKERRDIKAQDKLEAENEAEKRRALIEQQKVAINTPGVTSNIPTTQFGYGGNYYNMFLYPWYNPESKDKMAYGGSMAVNNGQKLFKGTQYNPAMLQGKNIIQENDLAPLTEYTGYKHSEGGIPVGQGKEVEDGETRFGDFIFSNQLKVPGTKMTFADKSKRIANKYKGRENDVFAAKSKTQELENLSYLNDVERMKVEREEASKNIAQQIYNPINGIGVPMQACHGGLIKREDGGFIGGASGYAKGGDLYNNVVTLPGMVDTELLGKGGHWIQGAVNPKHKGYCTPMTKSTCTPRRKAFAMTMKKHHGFHALGGDLQYANGGPKLFDVGGPYKDPTGDTNWTYDYKDGKWFAYDKTGTEYDISAPKFKKSTDILNKNYPEGSLPAENYIFPTSPIYGTIPNLSTEDYSTLISTKELKMQPSKQFSYIQNTPYSIDATLPKNTIMDNSTEEKHGPNYKSMMASPWAYAAQGAGNLYDIGLGIFAKDKVNFDRVAYIPYTPKYVDYSPAVQEARRQGNIGASQLKKYTSDNSSGAGNALARYNAGIATLRGTTGATIGDVLMQQNYANVGIDNAARLQNVTNRIATNTTNAQIQMAESIARQQERDAKRTSVSAGLHGLADLAGVYAQDTQGAKVQAQILPWLNTDNWEIEYDEEGTPIGYKFKQTKKAN